MYGQEVKRASYANEDKINISDIITRDEYGRQVIVGRDRDLNGELNLGDTWRTHIYNDQGLAYKVTDTLANGNENVNFYFYDELNRRNVTFWDKNRNDVFDGDDSKNIITFYGQTSNQDTLTTVMATDESTPTRIEKFIYLNAGEQGTMLGILYAYNGKEFTDLAYNVYGSVVASNEDYTTENWHRFFDKVGGKIEVINMADARASTVITLDNDVLSKITDSQLRILGDNTDTVNLKDSTEFTKLEGTKRVSGNDYHQYETQVGEETYTLLIDTDVNINLL